jgi:hypothetical protein
MAANEQNPADVPVIYANAIRLGLSFSDVKIMFGENVSVVPATQKQPTEVPAHIVDRVCIALSPDIVPAIIAGLTQAVTTYESQFGPLRKLPGTSPATAPTPTAESAKPSEKPTSPK